MCNDTDTRPRPDSSMTIFTLGFTKKREPSQQNNGALPFFYSFFPISQAHYVDFVRLLISPSEMTSTKIFGFSTPLPLVTVTLTQPSGTLVYFLSNPSPSVRTRGRHISISPSSAAHGGLRLGPTLSLHFEGSAAAAAPRLPAGWYFAPQEWNIAHGG